MYLKELSVLRVSEINFVLCKSVTRVQHYELQNRIARIFSRNTHIKMLLGFRQEEYIGCFQESNAQLNMY